MAHDILNTTTYTKDHMEFSETDDTLVDEHGDMWTASDCLEEVRGLLFDGVQDSTVLETIEALVSLDVKEDFYESNGDIPLPKARGEHFSTDS